MNHYLSGPTNLVIHQIAIPNHCEQCYWLRLHNIIIVLTFIIVLWPFCGTTESFCHYIHHHMFVTACYEAKSCTVSLLYKMHSPIFWLFLWPTAATATYFLWNVIFTVHHAPYHLLYQQVNYTVFVYIRMFIMLLLNTAHHLCTTYLSVD